jgi:asparagine synthase (glutamine-hydrolysing)
VLADVLNAVDGYYCAAIYNIKTAVVKLTSDRYGMQSLYWYHHGGVFAWGSEVKALVAVPGLDLAVNPSSFGCFMDLGHMLGENTWFQHIRLIHPATIVELRAHDQQPQQTQYWRWSDIRPSSMSFEVAVDELGDRFVAAVARRFNPSERVGISLSGGLDSRANLAAVHELYPDYRGYAYTFGMRKSLDVAIASQVAKRARWRHQVFQLTAHNWLEPRLSAVWRTDGMQDMKHMHGVEFSERVGESCSCTLNGYLGDAVLGGSYLERSGLSDCPISREIAEFYYGTHACEYNDVFYASGHYDHFLYMMRGRRFVNAGHSTGAGWARKPFFDNGVIELVFALPDSYRVNNRLYSAMLQRRFPKFFRDIAWTRTGRPAGVVGESSILTVGAPRRLGIDFVRRAARKVRRVCSRLLSGSSLQYADYNKWIRSPDVAAGLVSILRREGSAYSRLFDDDFEASMLRPHLIDPAIDNSDAVLRAATVAVYFDRVRGLL